METYRKKRRVAHGPSKSELRAARGKQDEKTLRQRFPQTTQLEIQTRLETTSGATLDQSRRVISPDQAFTSDIACLGGCGGGSFLLTDAVETLIRDRTETREGMAICQAASYNDPKLPCGTKLFYRITISYGPPSPSEAVPS